MADEKISALASTTTLVNLNTLFVTANPGVTNNRVTPNVVAQFVVPIGAASPDGVLLGYQHQLFVQLTLPTVFFVLWVNTDGITAWSVAYGAGSADPNGVVKGIRGAIYMQVPGDGTARPWINTTGGTVWV